MNDNTNDEQFVKDFDRYAKEGHELLVKAINVLDGECECEQLPPGYRYTGPKLKPPYTDAEIENFRSCDCDCDCVTWRWIATCLRIQKEHDELKKFSEHPAGFGAAMLGRLTQLEQFLKQDAEDWAEDDDTIKELCRPILGDEKVDGDSYGVPDHISVAVETINLLKKKLKETQSELDRYKQF
jgi:mRNA-degrading endonuclease YafQ of YafQ-DinJ toxin-antitoxin module